MSIAAQKALESEFELDIRVSPVSSTPQIEAEYSQDCPSGLCSILLTPTLSTITTFNTCGCHN